MHVEFDANKDAINRLKHGVSLAMAGRMDFAATIIDRDKRFDYGEDRFQALGPIGGRLYLLAFAMRDGTLRPFRCERPTCAKGDAMTAVTEKPVHISQEDWDDSDLPEWTEETFARSKPFSEVFPKQFETWKRGRGRPKVDRPKVAVAWRLAADVVDHIKGTGKGYTGRVEKVLRDAIAKGVL